MFMMLSDKLERYRTDRPDEWTMDEFARHARCLEDALKELPKAIEEAYREGYNDGYNDCHDSRPEPDSAWLKSGTKKALDEGIGDGVKV